MNRCPIPRPLHRGFTLVELLTVIAIVGILAAIIIPVTAKVRSSARKAACTSNLRQIGTAFLLYQNDNKGSAVPAWNADTKRLWFQVLLGVNDTGGAIGSSYIDGTSMPTCPSLEVTQTLNQSGGYGMSDLQLWNPGRRVSAEPLFYSRQLKRPQEWPLFMDADVVIVYGLDNPTENVDSKLRFAARHGDAANVLMADVHIEQVRYGDTRWKQANLNDGTHY